MKNEKTIWGKLLDAQREIGAIKKTSDNPYFKSKYFDINAVLEVVKPVLNKNGLVLTQALVTRTDTGKTGIETSVVDAETEKGLHFFVEIPTMPDPQKTGSCVTYYRRYALQSLLALEADDDDGNVASGKQTDVQYKTVKGTKVVDTTKLPEEPFI